MGEQKLIKKGHGGLIHVSDFIEEENGRLIVYNEEGDVVKDAHHIIYPGVGNDLWWDHKQLLMQVDKAIEIFEEAHCYDPDYPFLFYLIISDSFLLTHTVEWYFSRFR